MIINVPDWCVIGKPIQFKMYNPNSEQVEWFTDRIISYSPNGFFHQAHDCPIYHNKFSDYGINVREIEI